MKQTIFMAMCGGRGQRLWPLSTKSLPKQFVAMHGTSSLLDLTLERFALMASSADSISVVTSAEHMPLLAQQHSFQAYVNNPVIEPCPKNTAPAILLACLTTHDWALLDEDPVIVFAPSDHYIADQQAFSQVIFAAVGYARASQSLCLIGIKPRYAATMYGYISADSTDNAEWYQISQFIEKPSTHKAQQLLESHHTWWNTGIFIARRSIFLDAFAQHTPELFRALTSSQLTREQAYASIEPLQFDTAVVEHLDTSVVFPASFVWRDLGDLDTFAECVCAHANNQQKNTVTLYGNDNLALSKKKMVAFLGVSNICLIETDDIILVKKTGHSDHVRDLITCLENDGFGNLL